MSGYKIVSKVELCSNQYELKIFAPYVVRNAKAGQFIILRSEENGERIPLTIADVDVENNLLTIVYMATGYTTKKLAQLNEGDDIPDLVGPLGKPTHIEKYGTVVCLAGGYGAAPCYLIAKAFKEAGNKVYMIMGARNCDLIFWKEKMKDACDELFITTDDGSLGEKGFVTNVLDRLMNREKTAQRVDVDGHSGLLGLLCAAGPPVIIRAAGAGTLFPAGFTVSVRIVLSLSRVLFFDLCHAVPPKSITKRRHTPLRAACLL